MIDGCSLEPCVAFSGDIWRWVTELKSIQLHNSFMYVSLRSIGLQFTLQQTSRLHVKKVEQSELATSHSHCILSSHRRTIWSVRFLEYFMIQYEKILKTHRKTSSFGSRLSLWQASWVWLTTSPRHFVRLSLGQVSWAWLAIASLYFDHLLAELSWKIGANKSYRSWRSSCSSTGRLVRNDFAYLHWPTCSASNMNKIKIF